jgi:hypothetical protein
MASRNSQPQRIVPLGGRVPDRVPTGLWQHSTDDRKEFPMLYTIAIVLLVLWILGFSVFHVAGALIHIVLVVAVVLFIAGLLRRGTA